MRFKTALAAGVAGVLALVGCSGPAPSANVPTPGAATASASPTPNRRGAGGEVRVSTWWTEGNDNLALGDFEWLFRKQYPNDTLVNLTPKSGTAADVEAKIAGDLAAHNPPDSFQAHAGADLLDHITAGEIEPVSDIIDHLGGASVFPSTLLQLLALNDEIYSIPSNVYRSNVVWTNPAVLAKASIGEGAPADLDAWLSDMQKLKDAGVDTPLAVGSAPWMRLHLFESVLLSELGAEKYNALFADGDWRDAGVVAAVDKYARLMGFATPQVGSDWPQVVDRVIDGQAAYTVMGDWAIGRFAERDKQEDTDFVWWATPGTEGSFLFLADSFVLAADAQNPGGAKDWLTLVGSPKAQKEFSLTKGSIPARFDLPDYEFPPYQRAAMRSFREDKLASSIAHGAAAPKAWREAMTNALTSFPANQDQASLLAALATASDTYR